MLDRVGVPYDTVDITGDDALEARYREWLPVVEIDGERAFVYHVDEAALRRKLSAATVVGTTARVPAALGHNAA